MFVKKLIASATVLAVAGTLLLGGGMAVRLRANAATDPAATEPLAKAEDDPRPDEKPGRPKAEVMEVAVAQPVVMHPGLTEQFRGRLIPVTPVPVWAATSGTVDWIHCKQGDIVKKGDRLFELNVKYRAAETQREKTLAAFERQLKEVEEERDKALERLKAGKGNSQEVQALDQRRTALQAIVVQQRSMLQGPARQVGTEEANRVRAPIAGRVGAIDLGRGLWVAGGDQPPAKPLTTISPLGAIGVRFDIDERTFLRYQRLRRAGEVPGVGGSIEVTLTADENIHGKATITHFDEGVDPQTGTLGVEATFPDPDQLLVPGMSVVVRLPMGKGNQILIVNTAALHPDGSKNYVWVVNEAGHVERRDVQVLGSPGPTGAVGIATGIGPRDWIIVASPEVVHPGQQVHTKQVSMRDVLHPK